MSKQRKIVASTYLYDPLDRLAASNSIQRFYNDTRIATEIEGERKSRFFETDSHPLALQQHGSLPGTTLLATDQQTSVLNGVSPEGALHAQAYSPFGHHPIGTSLNGAGFNGERPEPLTGHYLLGQGYRAFNPVLMRFNSPDSWSPFGEGGINAYAYCDNDPLNKVDPTGHFPNIWKGLKNIFTSRVYSKKKLVTKVSADVLKKYTPATETISTTHGLQVASDIAPPPYSAGNFRTRNITSTEYLSPPPYRKTAPAYDNTGITIAPITTPGKAKKNRPPSYWESQNIHRPKNSNATPVQTIAHQSNDSFEPIQRLSPDTIRRNRDFLRRHVISGRR